MEPDGPAAQSGPPGESRTLIGRAAAEARSDGSTSLPDYARCDPCSPADGRAAATPRASPSRLARSAKGSPPIRPLAAVRDERGRRTAGLAGGRKPGRTIIHIQGGIITLANSRARTPTHRPTHARPHGHAHARAHAQAHAHGGGGGKTWGGRRRAVSLKRRESEEEREKRASAVCVCVCVSHCVDD